MRRILNTLYVLTEDSYLSLDGENVVIYKEAECLGRFPLHGIEAIYYFGYKGASPALMGACAKRDINLCYLTPRGRFLARTVGEIRGNVLLRKEQFRISDSAERSLPYARNFNVGKIYNCRWILERATRDHALQVDVDKLKETSRRLHSLMKLADACGSMDALRGYEGEAANLYFSQLDALILKNREVFCMKARTRRPPLDPFNAMLSFVYVLLANDCAAALESVGLDAYVGFMHTDRPGRASLALDIMEELRPIMADKFVISCVNNRIVDASMFDDAGNGAILLTDSGKRAILSAWQTRKREQMTHPFLKEKMPWGLAPYVQALLLARCIRGDLEAYPPLLWK